MKETYKDIKGYEGIYQVSNLGNVKRLNYRGTGKERLLKNYLGCVGYYKICLSKDGKVTTVNIHRLISQTFIPNPENKPQVNHINGIKTDNNIKNLEWVTSKENMQHAHDTGLIISSKGEHRSLSKLTEIQVLEIRKIGKLKTQIELSRMYNVDQSLISYVLNNKIWKHV